MKSLSCVPLFGTPRMVAYQAPPSMGFSRQEYWSGLPFPSPADLPNPGIEPGSPALQTDTLPSEPQGKPPFSSQHRTTMVEMLDLEFRNQGSNLPCVTLHYWYYCRWTNFSGELCKIYVIQWSIYFIHCILWKMNILVSRNKMYWTCYIVKICAIVFKYS